jgi:hypothetical protein
MTQTYKAPNGRHCVINEGAKPANPHTLIGKTKENSPSDNLKHSHTDIGEQALLSRDDQKLKAEHVVVNYVGPNGEVLGSEEVRRDSLTPA